MAIQIPQVKRNAPQGAESVGRMEIQAPDAKPYLQNLQTVQKTLETGADLAFKFQKQAEDNNVKELATQYKMKLYGDGTEGDDVWTVNKFQRTPKEGQDFTPYYGNYNDYRQKLRTEILDSGVSDRVRSRLEQEMMETDFYANRTVNVEYFKSNNIRDEKIHEATQNSGLQIDLPVAIAEYNPKDLGTQVRLNTVINTLVKNQKDYLINKGYEDGDTALTKELNDYEGAIGLMAAQDALITRDVDKAKAIFEEYKPLIPANKSQGLVSQIAKVEEDRTINRFVDEFRLLAEDEGRAKIMKEVPEKHRDEVLRRFTSDKRQEVVIKNRISSVKADELRKKALSKRYRTVNEFLADPETAATFNSLTSENQRGVLSAIGFRPAVGDSVKAFELESRIEELAKMPGTEWEKETDSLSTPQFKRIERKVLDARLNPGPSQKALGKLTKGVKLMTAPYMKFGLFDQQNGQLTYDGKAVWHELVQPFIDQEAKEMPKNPSDEELKSFEKDIRQKIKTRFDRARSLKDLPALFKIESTPRAEETEEAKQQIVLPPVQSAVVQPQNVQQTKSLRDPYAKPKK
jgi:hypothetical protein